jgi:hypothetical protein
VAQPAHNLGQLRCLDMATGSEMRLWVRPLLITVYRCVLPACEYREAC